MTIRYLFTKVSLASLLFALSVWVQSCSQQDIPQSENTDEAGFTMQMKSVPIEIMNNTRVYVFDNSGAYPNHLFVKEQLNITRTGDKLFTYMPVGTWNLVLLSCDANISGNMNQILPGTPMTSKMWETRLNASGNYLEQTPSELRHAFIPNTLIQESTIEYKTATLARNVAKIQIILKDYSGFDDFTPDAGGHVAHAYAELLDVPNALRWDGQLFPSTVAPQLATKPMHEPFNFNYADDADLVGFPVSELIVPADKDGLGTHKIKLKVSMPLNNTDYYGKTANEDFEIDYVPKANGIIRVFVTFRGEPDTQLSIKITVKDWKDYIDQTVEF